MNVSCCRASVGLQAGSGRAGLRGWGGDRQECPRPTVARAVQGTCEDTLGRDREQSPEVWGQAVALLAAAGIPAPSRSGPALPGRPQPGGGGRRGSAPSGTALTAGAVSP